MGAWNGRRILLCAVLAAAVVSRAQQPAGGGVNPAAVPEDRMGEGWWAAQHQAVVEEAARTPDAGVVLIGDSITDNYRKAKPPDENFQPVWREFYAPKKALNLGFSGDTTSNVLWRLEHGEVAGLRPKAAVLLIGTNNTAWHGQTAGQVEGGIEAVVSELERLLPATKILVVGILPSGISEKKTAEDRAVNASLAARYGHDARVTFLDIGAIFYKDGALNTAIFYDPRLPRPGAALHPDTEGQRKMAEALEPALEKLMR